MSTNNGQTKVTSAGNYGLLSKITCPHCWHRSSPGDLLWVSQHADLIGDAVAGPDAQKRFVPSRFNSDCQALDSRGMACQLLACPRCHLVIPRALTRTEPFFLSIVGGPSSGKTWLLTSMTWSLRRVLPTGFKLQFTDADTLCNVMLNENEAKLFLSENPDELTNLHKTEEKGGGFYDSVSIDGQPMQLPKPFVFQFKPSSDHPRHNMDNIHRVMCLYDNAGESFQPGHDTALNPTTQHLAKSRAIMFLFDPTQDPRFREKCRAFSTDPQLAVRPKMQQGESAMSQHTLLIEAAQRVRRYAGVPHHKKHERPLLVLVAKSDVWEKLTGEDLASEPFVDTGRGLKVLDMPRIERISSLVRNMLLENTPEIVSAAEEFCQWVIYIPVSALGGPPEFVDGKFGSRPRNVKPRWVTVPFLYLFARWSTNTVFTTRNIPQAGAEAASRAEVSLA